MTLKPVLPTLLTLAIAGTCFSQTERPASTPSPVPTAKVSDQLSKLVEAMRPEQPTPREQKEKAYAKMLEGQRYVWSGDRLRSMAARQSNITLAKQAFQESVELDPSLSEGYTALAELAINGQPQDVEEAIKLAALSAKVNPNNFGARRIMARLYTFQSRITNGTFRPELGDKAIGEWRQVVRL